jgi:phosphoenolpyruvate-protein phosphotransferase (PTS system enzyme I)
MTVRPNEPKDRMQGIPVSPGIIIGKAHLVDRSTVQILYQYLIDEKQIAGEVERFEHALRTTEKQLETLKNKMPEHVKEHSFILDSHLMILKDSMLCDSTIRRIQEERINAEWALKKSFHEIRKIFAQIDDDYISNRIQDVESVSERILRNLSGEMQENLAEIRERVIIVAHDLSPADTTELNISKVMGFITDVGGQTSHTAIMAQALEIPAVVGLEAASERISDGELLIVDGSTGEVVINPDDADIIRYQEKQLQHEKYKSTIAKISHLPAETPDGYRIAIKANIEFLEEVAAVRDHGAEGIGLYRTEFLYLRSKGLPTEEELFNDYREVAEIMAPDPVTIRTLDLGGDKFASQIDIVNEMNPAMGLRAIRLCLREPGLFRTQLRAILRASIFGRVQLMFPMISGVQEVLEVKEILNAVKQELDGEGIIYDENMPVGVMIEIPSAVTISDLLTRHVDFFSIGTNDLIQYALAIDRVNEHVAYMYQPFHPAILRMIRQVVQEGRKAGIKISLCGEMAGDPLCTPILLGLGLDELSLNARSIPLVKTIVRSIPLKQARHDFKQVLQLNTAKEVRDYLLKRMKKLIPELGERGFFPA